MTDSRPPQPPRRPDDEDEDFGDGRHLLWALSRKHMPKRAHAA